MNRKRAEPKTPTTATKTKTLPLVEQSQQNENGANILKLHLNQIKTPSQVPEHLNL